MARTWTYRRHHRPIKQVFAEVGEHHIIVAIRGENREIDARLWKRPLPAVVRNQRTHIEEELA